MRKRSKSTSSKKSLITGIGIASFSLGSFSTYLAHTKGSEDMSILTNEILSKKQRTINQYQHEQDATKQAQLRALEAEDKWYEEISKTQKAREDAKAAKREMITRASALEAEKQELLRLQEIAHTEKQKATEAIIRSYKAKSLAEDHALNAYETTLLAEDKLDTAKADQEKADLILSKYEQLEDELVSTKRNYANLEAQYQIITNENKRLAQLASIPKKEIIVVNNPPTTTTEYIHTHTETIINKNNQNHRPKLHPSKQIKPSKLATPATPATPARQKPKSIPESIPESKHSRIYRD